MSRRRSALRRLGDLLAPDGPSSGVIGVDPGDDVLTLAAQHQLLPALRSSLAAAHAQPTVDGLRALHVRNLARNLALVDELTELMAALAGAGIPAAPLKGIDAVLEDLYADWGARTMADLDVLVEPSSGQAAAEVLADLGYRPTGPDLPGHHHLTPMTAPGRVGVVEVHVGLQDRRTGFLDAHDVLARASPHPDLPGLRLDRTDAATHLVDHAQHAAGRHRVVVDVRAMHETALVVRRVPEVDWALVADRFARDGCRERFDAHLGMTAELFGVGRPTASGRAGRLVVRRELFVDDHAVLGLLDRPGRRIARFRRDRLERYYETPLSGAATWRARSRFLGEVAAHRRRAIVGARRPRSGGRSEDTGVDVTPPA